MGNTYNAVTCSECDFFLQPDGPLVISIACRKGVATNKDQLACHQWRHTHSEEVMTSAGSAITNGIFSAKCEAILDGIKETLITKNKNYGNSALEPLRVFSKADPVEQLKVRIDDKLSRISRGSKEGISLSDESFTDTVRDLIGYLVLFLIASDNEKDNDKK